MSSEDLVAPRYDICFHNSLSSYKESFRIANIMFILQFITIGIYLLVQNIEGVSWDQFLFIGVAMLSISLMINFIVQLKIYMAITKDNQVVLRVACKLRHVIKETGVNEFQVRPKNQVKVHQRIYNYKLNPLVQLSDKDRQQCEMNLKEEIDEEVLNQMYCLKILHKSTFFFVFIFLAMVVKQAYENSTMYEFCVVGIIKILQSLKAQKQRQDIKKILTSPCIVYSAVLDFIFRIKSFKRRYQNLPKAQKLTPELQKQLNCVRMTCRLCTSQLKTGQNVRLLGCSNQCVYHSFCLIKWSWDSVKCPRCDLIVLNESIPEQLSNQEL